MTVTPADDRDKASSSDSGPGSYLEPWMRGTHLDIDPLRRAVIHALELTQEDLPRHIGTISDEAVHVKPYGLPSLAFHLRHIARSLDRLLTYAEGRMLDRDQLEKLSTEHETGGEARAIEGEFTAGLHSAIVRILAIDPATYAEPRGIGRKQLPTTVAGLLIHCAEHTQRHAGQLVTTEKLVRRPIAEGTA